MSNKKDNNAATASGSFEIPEFTFRSLFQPPVLNPVTRKSYTLPIFRLDNQYSINFHLAWFGQFVAFLSWFAFSPLIPSAVKNDLKLTPLQIANSNLVSLSSTLLARIAIGPVVDRWGPRKAMAGLLLFGAIPSGLAGTAHNAGSLYTIRFFIGFLGGVFVPCQAWPTAFFDKKIVGRSNALTAGWGNMGGGLTFIIMTLVYNALVNQQHITSHIAWRIAFVIIPVPAIFMTVTLILIFGTDHPAGKWSERHTLPAQGGPGVIQENKTVDTASESGSEDTASNKEKKGAQTSVAVKNVEEGIPQPTPTAAPAYNTKEVLMTPVTWLPAMAYITTLGWEVTMNATLSGTLLTLFGGHTFTQTKAGYLASVYGLLNLWARPLGGYLGDVAYSRWGVNGKKYLMLGCGFLEGGLALALGLYIEFDKEHRGLAAVVVCLVIMAHLNFLANGACFSLVPHCSPQANGLVSGLVGGLGNLGGIIFALIFRFQTIPGKAFWVGGIFIMCMNLLASQIRIPTASR